MIQSPDLLCGIDPIDGAGKVNIHEHEIWFKFFNLFDGNLTEPFSSRNRVPKVDQCLSDIVCNDSFILNNED